MKQFFRNFLIIIVGILLVTELVGGIWGLIIIHNHSGWISVGIFVASSIMIAHPICRIYQFDEIFFSNKRHTEYDA